MSSAMSHSSAIYSKFGNDPDLAELVVLYVQEMPERIAVLEKHFVARDWDELRRAAHQMKGAAGSYGFDEVSELAAKLEHTIARGEDVDPIQTAFEELLGICRRARSGTSE